MRFLVDECTGSQVARWLRQSHHDVFSVLDEDRGMDDDAILRKAFDENRILITNDKDFGEMVFRERQRHRGIVFLRLDDESPAVKIAILSELLKHYGDRLTDQFVVVTENQVRFERIV